MKFAIANQWVEVRIGQAGGEVVVGGQGFTLSFLMILGCRPRTREFRQGADIQGSDAGLPLFIFDATEEQIAGAF